MACHTLRRVCLRLSCIISSNYAITEQGFESSRPIKDLCRPMYAYVVAIEEGGATMQDGVAFRKK